MKILITGGCGFVGTNLGIYLKRKGYKISSLDNLSRKGSRYNLKLIKKNMNRFTHFNIQRTFHKPGKNYLIIKIHKQGYFDGTTYKQSILDSNNFIFAKCLSAQNNIDYVDLKEKVFEHSLSNIKNVDALKKAIKRRYKKSLSHLSDRKKLSLGVAITELKIIKSFFDIKL